MGIKITLRQKSISKGRQTLYLDIWPPIIHPKTGKPTRREFLGLYLFLDKAQVKKEIDSREMVGKDTAKLRSLYKSLDPLSNFDKKHNQEMLKIARAIRNRRVNDLNKGEIYSGFEQEQLRIKEVGEGDFTEYFRKMAEKRTGNNRGNWLAALKYLKAFANGPLKFSDITERKINDFKDFLQSRDLAQNSKVSYFLKFKTALKQAFRDGIFQTDLNARIKGIKEKKTHREYLTLAELNKLAGTPCNDAQLKRAGLFSALTGLRFSDIEKMTWSEVQREGDLYLLKFRQQKTDTPENLPIAEQAYELLGDPGEPSSKVFNNLRKSVYNNDTLIQWLKAAGISKKFTFHGFRHTYAVIQLFSGTDIFTVSKMLGHQNLSTTQVYAKIVDELKIDAANRIKLNM